MLQRLAVPVRPGKTDGAPRPGGKAWLGVFWSLTEVVLTVSTSGRQDGPQESPFFAENATVFFSQEQGLHTKHRKGGEGVFLEGVAVLIEYF